MRRIVSGAVLGPVMLAVLLMSAAPANAHEHRHVNGHDVTVGWLEEPAFAGFQNAVSFAVAHEDGDPVEGAELEVEVIFGGRGGEQRTDMLPLEPAFGSTGEYRASLIPTRPGTYTFHVVGSFSPGEDVDEYFTSGPDTFSDIEETDPIEFPVADPSTGELTELVTRLGERLEDVQAAVDETRAALEASNQGTPATQAELAAAQEQIEAADSAAGTARTIAFIAAALAVAAVAAAVVVVVRPRRLSA
jgi:YtkA-like